MLSFTQKSCLKNIREDLHHYYRLLSAQPDADRLLQTTVLSSLQELMQVIYLSIYLYFMLFYELIMLSSTKKNKIKIILNRNALHGTLKSWKEKR